MSEKSSQSQKLRVASAGVPPERRLHDLESILSVTRAMAAEPELRLLLPKLAAACSQVLQAERTSLWVIDPASGELITYVAERTESLRVPRGKGIVGAVAASGRTELITDAYADARFNPDVDKKTGFRTREIACIPLRDIDGQRVVGVLQILNKNNGGKFTAYDVELASIIAAQAGVVLEQAALRELATEKRRLQAEMDLAHSIQQRLLPQQDPQLPGLQVAGCNHAASEASGDYFDYIPLPDGALGLVVADVTGHGLGAALIMTAARAYMRATCTGESRPDKILSCVNGLLEKDLTDGNFISLCLAAFQPGGRSLSYASAGHDPPLVYRPAQAQFAELDSTGPLLGILPEAEFAAAGPLALCEGDVLVFMTDGLFECMNPSGETFGKQRLQAVIQAEAEHSAAEILRALLATTATWMHSATLRDDITVVIVKVT